jgi:hypothetical protein
LYSGELKRQAGDFPPCFSEENPFFLGSLSYLPVKLALMPARLRMPSSSACQIPTFGSGDFIGFGNLSIPSRSVHNPFVFI